MRTLERNKKLVWVVDKVGMADVIDENGFSNGEVITMYSEPIQVKLSMYPKNGTVTELIFGTDVSLDMVVISNDVILNSDSLIFFEKPTSNYKETYDLRVSKISESLNTNVYGLVRRT